MIEHAFRQRAQRVLLELQYRVIELEMGSATSNNSVVARGLRPLRERR